MRSLHRRGLALALFAALAATALAPAQQVIQRGALGLPGSVIDETQQWTTPLAVAGDKEVEIYIPDVTATAWLQRNYADFEGRDAYTLTFFTHYKSEAACRHNQVLWGLGDAEHLNACAAINYRVHQAVIDAASKTVTLQMAAMVDPDGNIVPDTTVDTATFRTWDQLDPTSLAAIKKANDLITRQMVLYDRKLRTLQR